MNLEFMDSLAIPGEETDYRFLGFSDLNILYTYVITFNKKMMSEEYTGKSVYNMDSPPSTTML